jgi:uncharacterized protein YjbI with pentapeptide repeats
VSDPAPPKVPQCRFCNETPYLVAPMVSQGLASGFTLTTVVKASYRLAPGEPLAPLATQIPFRGDEWVGDDFHGGLHHGTDLVAWKPRTDVILRATCHAPGGQPTTHCEAGFGVGDWQKVVTVVGDRTWKVGLFSRTPGQPQAFTRMPIDWEHSYGGPDYAANPAGKGFRSDLLPNIEDPATPLAGYGDRVPPAGFLPINRMWKQRFTKMGTADGSYLKKRFPLFPADFDFTYFNEAPEDQQLEHPLRGDEEVRFLHVHPEVASWSVRLPGTRVRCLIADTDADGAARVREVEMRCDTLLANVEEGYLHLIWRGHLPIRSENRAEVTTFYIVEEPLVGATKTAAEHAADLPLAKDQGQKLQAQIEAKFGEIVDKTAGTLKRYGLEMPDLTPPAKPGPTAEQLACYPFNPQGPLPEKFARFQGQIDEAARKRTAALDQLRPLGKAHGVDVDATPSGPKVDILAQYKKGLEDGVAMLQKQGHPIPDAVAHQLAEVSKPGGGDPFGIAQIAASFKAAGMDLATNRNPVIAAVATGSTAAVLAAMPTAMVASPHAPFPGATRAVTESVAPAAPAGAVTPPFAIAGSPVLPPPPPRTPGAQTVDDMRAFLAKGGRCQGQNFYGADFTGLDLTGHDFSGALLINACFRQAKLGRAIFANTLLRNADFVAADLTGAKLGWCDYQQADFSYARLHRVEVHEAAFIETRFHASDFTDATFHKLMVTGSDFTAADLTRVVVTGGGVWHQTKLDGAVALGSRWHEVMLSECSLIDADFTGSSVTDTVLFTCNAQRIRLAGCQLKGLRAFNGTDLQGAVMAESRMRDTSWMYVRLDEADFSHGDLRQANFMFSSCVKTRFAGADLKAAVLRHARLLSADLERANLCRATFGRADLTMANLQRSNCYETDFQDAVILQTRFQEANLVKTNLPRD